MENSRQLALSLRFSRLSNPRSLSLSSHTVCVPAASYFTGPLLDSRQFASIFRILLELHSFCLSKTIVREDLKTWGLCKAEGKDDQGSTTESWSQINWIIVWVLCYYAASAGSGFFISWCLQIKTRCLSGHYSSIKQYNLARAQGKANKMGNCKLVTCGLQDPADSKLWIVFRIVHSRSKPL